MNAINDQHVAGQIGVRLGHGGNANSTSNYIESIYAFRNPANLSQYLPVSGLVFSLHDVDAADNVIVDAYPAGSSTPISLSTSIYTLDTSTGATVVSYAGSNRFTSQAVDIGNRRGTINFDFAGYSIDRVVLRYYDTSDAGTYTAAGFLACNATLTLNKTTLGGSGGPFGFTLTNTSRNTGGTATTSAANSPVQVDGNAGTAGVQPFGIANAAAAVTIAESSLPTGWSLTNATCSNAAGTTVGSLASGTYTIPGGSIGPAAALTCTFTNARTTLRLQKALPNGRTVGSDQFTLSIAGAGAPAAVTTTGSGSTATGAVTHATATAGSSYTLSESAAGSTVLANYTTTYSCTNARAGGQTPSGSGTSFSVTPVAGDDLTCTFANTAPSSTPLTCDATLYLTQTGGVLYTINRSGNPFTYQTLGTASVALNAMAYNPADNYLYALRNLSGDDGRRLYRIDASGNRVELGLVTGLPAPPTSISYFAGAFTTAGDNALYVTDGVNDNRMYRIDVTTLQATLITLSRNLYVADFDYIGGLFYGIEGSTGQLVSIHPINGTVTNIGTPGPTGIVGAIWADNLGLYGVLNTGGFYRFDTVTGARTLISGSPTTSSNDGARCPVGPPLTFNADLAITKTDGATTYTPGTNVVYTIVASNNGPFGAQNARVQDALPSGITTASWTCAAANGAACRTASGTGAIDTRVDLPVGGTATFALTMAVPTNFTGNLVNTATVTPDVGNSDPVPGNNSATDTNGARTALTLIKTVTNDDGGTQSPIAWTLSAAGPTPISGTTGSAAVTNVAVNPGTYTLSESAFPSGYSATPYSCAINGGVPVSGNSITLAAGDNAVCRIHNDDTGVAGQPAACGITSHSGASGASFVFGPGGVNASASLQNITFDAGSTAGGSINRFVDSTGRAYTTPAGPGRWLLTNSNTTTRLTVTFSPAIPAHRIGLAIYDIGTWDATMPNNSEDPAYNPSLTLSLSGGATSGQFVAHQTGALATLARYTPASGVVTMDSTAYQSGVERTWRQSVFLRGNANALVSTLTLTATNIKPGDNIGFGLVAIPSCVTVSKVTEGGVGSFDFTTTNINNWDSTAAASPITLTTAATGTPVSSARHYYAHPISSNSQGTQPVTLSEAIPASWILSPAQCTDANSSRNGNTGSFGSLAGGTLTIPADRMRFESNITCTFTNTRAAILRLQKALPDGRAAAADQFTLSMTGAGAPAPLTTTGTGSTAAGTVSHATATPGSAYVLSEAAAGGADLTHYVSSYSCSNARSGGQAPSGSGASFGVTPAAGDDLTCTFSNLRRSTDISILKTVAADPVVSGGQAQFTLVVTNHGPMAADGATVRDPAMAGLDCTTAGLPAPTCSATPGTTCPSPLTAAGLQAGLPVPTFPSGGVVTLGLTCSVTASGTP
ncbi:DUF11 domain-containing protein [Pseudoxanthomonas sp. PXM01]|uniref:prealbumin-like fold domain-containing protein n=1 Tax=Pseudoxanthomonas sp. PXM01 TaxID=2769295 RepID=UPI0017855EE6|nr:DUF11 domain-containing protein [Pseudoxanthomonas sp. PXM01]